ncbi:hypothetical protein CGRA01v4_07551 [Colletotrichum graminicola]|nr:hypothetical protein CGRA01v4_07551 [Colletotrichum graminicola]
MRIVRCHRFTASPTLISTLGRQARCGNTIHIR